MENEDVIREQMEETRTSLTEKLETLENKVTSTVQNAASNVAETMENVKGTVEETVAAAKNSVTDGLDAVKDFFNLPAHVRHHPWPMLGGSIGVGFLVGYCLRGRSASPAKPAAKAVAAPEMIAATPPAPTRGNGRRYREEPEASAPRPKGILSSLTPEVDKLKGLAIGALLGMVRDMVVDATPPNIAPSLARIIDDMTEKVGGTPVKEDRSEAWRARERVT